MPRFISRQKTSGERPSFWAISSASTTKPSSENATPVGQRRPHEAISLFWKYRFRRPPKPVSQVSLFLAVLTCRLLESIGNLPPAGRLTPTRFPRRLRDL